MCYKDGLKGKENQGDKNRFILSANASVPTLSICLVEILKRYVSNGAYVRDNMMMIVNVRGQVYQAGEEHGNYFLIV